MFKDFAINFALWMSVRRAKQAEKKLAASTWWSDLSETIEEGISLRGAIAPSRRRQVSIGKPS